MSTMSAHRLAERIQRAHARTASDDDFFAQVSTEVGKVVPFDGSMWFGVDPATLIASAPARVENMDASLCWPFWSGEFQDNDLIPFRDVARRPEPVASLRLAAHGRPQRSPRYREFLQPQGYDDEVRVAFRTGKTTWAVAALYRDRGRSAFGADDLRVLLDISRTVGVALRERSVLDSAWGEPLVGPGVLLFDKDALLLSANTEAKAWLRRIYGPTSGACSWEEVLATCHSDSAFRFPLMQSLVSHARAIALGYEEGPARLRLRDRGGRWVVLHASCLDPSDAAGPVVIVVEPATSAEVAPIIVEAYGLSPRERDVVRGVARGMSTPEIAADLLLSGHTVRDYLKSVFEKVGVGSRGELIAKLFAEHYSDSLHETMVHV
jgi:DNA-binding CsgD family transcriptional regulator